MKIKVTLTQNPLTHSLGFASTKPGQTPTPLGNHGGDSFMQKRVSVQSCQYYTTQEQLMLEKLEYQCHFVGMTKEEFKDFLKQKDFSGYSKE